MNVRVSDLAKLVVFAFVLLVLWRFSVHIAHLLLLVALVMVVSMILAAPVAWLQRLHIPRGWAALIVAVVILGCAVEVILLVLPPLVQEGSVFIVRFPDLWHRTIVWLTRFGHRYPEFQRVISPGGNVANTLAGRVSGVLSNVVDIARSVVEDLGGTVLIFVMVIFVLSEPRPLLRGLFSMLPEDYRRPVARALSGTARLVRIWAWSALLIGGIEGLTVYLGLWALGVQPALLLALLTFFGEFLPYVGPILSSIPAIGLALLIDPILAVWVLGLYLGVHILESSLLIPLITSRQMKFHPLSVAFAIAALGETYGVIGAVLAVPTLAAAKSFYTELILEPRKIHAEDMDHYADTVVRPDRHQAHLGGGDGPGSRGG
jgi:putative permease